MCVSTCFSCSYPLSSTPAVYTLSLHDALPISRPPTFWARTFQAPFTIDPERESTGSNSHPVHIGRITMGRKIYVGNLRDRKSTRLNSSHLVNSYAVF